MNGVLWTAQEDAALAYLRESDLTNREIGDLIGRTAYACAIRAYFLGLPRRKTRGFGALRKKAGAVAAQHAQKTRECMCCHERFKSQGNHNRLCAECRKLDVGIQPVKILTP